MSRAGDAAWATELSAIARYYDRTIDCRHSAAGVPSRLDAIDCATKLAVTDLAELPDLRDETARRTLLLVEPPLDGVAAVERTLTDILPRIARTTRVAIISRSRSLALPVFSGWDVVRDWPCSHRCRRGPGVAACARRAAMVILRPIIVEPPDRPPSLSIIVPARNERGTIGEILGRMPDLRGAQVEVIFVEGHSRDGTWQEIERVIADAPARPRLQLKALRQTGRGKADAVRLGIGGATGDLVAILDADLSVPPESLTDFYNAYCEGRGDFINGERLSLPMERGAMRPLNKLGNRFFAWAVGHVLRTPIRDCLCGTKLFARHDWRRFAAWRADFGGHDPFGDFDLLFPAATLGLGIVNQPVPYGARAYGKTNIHRFRDGAKLLRMTCEGWWRIRMGRK